MPHQVPRPAPHSKQPSSHQVDSPLTNPGIGRAVSIAFALAGCRGLALLDINISEAEETKKIIDSALTKASLPTIPIHAIACDVTREDSVNDAYATASSLLPRIDYSIHCAGIITFGAPSTTTTVSDFDRQNAINYRGLWMCSRQALTLMQRQTLDCEAYPEAQIKPIRAQRGSIVNISSGLALISQRDCPAYSGAKAAVTAITRSDAIDYVEHRIRVNAVLPGICDTPITAPTPEIRDFLTKSADGPVARTPMKRLGFPEEIADTCVFVAGNRASFMTGSSIVVDGGTTAC